MHATQQEDTMCTAYFPAGIILQYVSESVLVGLRTFDMTGIPPLMMNYSKSNRKC
jgi:hypothetical protein